MVYAATISPDEIAGEKRLVVGPQLAVEQIQLFNIGMAMGWIVPAWREANKHRNPARLRLDRKQFAEQSFCCKSRPVRLIPMQQETAR